MTDTDYMRAALRLARRGSGTTSPNPMVGAVLAKGGQVIGRGWHRRAGGPHAEVEAIRDAEKKGHSPKGATVYVTLEPCCTQGRTPPCTDALVAAKVKRVVIGATDPNPKHRGTAFDILKGAGIRVDAGVLASECEQLNRAFNHWIVHRTPFVTVKSAMTLDGKIATADGESKWITSPESRSLAMQWRAESDAILAGVNTILQDNPKLTVRGLKARGAGQPRRIILDSLARTPLDAHVIADAHAQTTTVFVSRAAPESRRLALAKRVNVVVAPPGKRRSPGTASEMDLQWILRQLGGDAVTGLLVEGGGEVNASFLLRGLAHRVAFFYAPKILGGRAARRAVAGLGAGDWDEMVDLHAIRWRRVGPDLLLTAEVQGAR